MALIAFTFPQSYRAVTPQQPAGGDVSQRTPDAAGSVALVMLAQTRNAGCPGQLGRANGLPLSIGISIPCGAVVAHTEEEMWKIV